MTKTNAYLGSKMKPTSVNINVVQKEVRLKDRHGHFLAIKRDGKIFVYCKRCKEFHEVTSQENEEHK